jgi:orotate phosphoribosyltransferase
MNHTHWQAPNHCDILDACFSEGPMAYREQLLKLLKQKSLVYGDVRLSSGKMSKYYLDVKMTTLDPEGALLTGYSVLELLDDMDVHPQAIGGPSMGADPIVEATVLVSFLKKEPLPGFLIRKERKEHGLGKQIEGIGASVKEIVIIDEVCTNGGSSQEAIDIAEREGYKILAVISLVDREEGGSARLREKYRYESVFTARQIMTPDDQSSGTDRLTPQPAHSRA